MTEIPENFDLLADGEQAIRDQSKAAIAASEDLSLHARMIERSLNVLYYMAQRRPHVDEDDLVMQMLTVRLFNSGASTMKLLMGGYYQTAVMVLRDILESTFLLDYFQSNPDQIKVWRECDEKTRLDKFGAGKIRTALDNRDGYKERKRAAAYALLCQLGTHPTYAGFQMMQKKGSDLVNVGPFFAQASLDAVLFELAKTIMQAGSLAIQAEERSIAEYRMSVEFMTLRADWSERFLPGASTDRDKIAFIKETVDEIERRGGLPRN